MATSSIARPASKSEPAQKSYQKILEQEITEGLKELDRETAGLFISGISAGLDVGFSLFLMGVMITLVHPESGSPLAAILVAMMYSVGFVFVVLGRSELFTEHTTRAVYPVLMGRASTATLLRLWVTIFIANLIGITAFAKLTTVIGPALGVIEPGAFNHIAHSLVEHPWWVLVLSGILAGWLMGLLSWLVTAGRDTISKVFFVGLITTAIGLCHLHHAILGSGEVLAAVFSHSGLGVRDYGYFLLWTTLGNIGGGVFFVALLKFSHVIRGGHEPKRVKIEDAAPH
jgi:formate/nitrite transporter FocA (FNT family)